MAWPDNSVIATILVASLVHGRISGVLGNLSLDSKLAHAQTFVVPITDIEKDKPSAKSEDHRKRRKLTLKERRDNCT